MPDYSCTSCNYKTMDRSNYIKHCTTKVHKNKVSQLAINSQSAPQKPFKNTFKCPYCENKYARSNNLTRHKQICPENPTFNKEDKIKDLENEIYNLKGTLTHKDEIVKILKEENDKVQSDIKYYKHLIHNAGSMVKTSISALSYVTKNYCNAPALEAMKDYSYLEYDENDSDFNLMETIIYEYNNQTLPQYLGDFIVTYYKKMDPQKQSIWNSDTSRLTYVIKEIIHKKSDWLVDKKGIRTSKFIIDPLVAYIKNVIGNYLETTENIDEYIHESAHKMKEILDKFRTAGEIMCDINNKVLQEQMLKYIAPYFYLNKNDDLLDIL